MTDMGVTASCNRCKRVSFQCSCADNSAWVEMKVPYRTVCRQNVPLPHASSHVATRPRADGCSALHGCPMATSLISHHRRPPQGLYHTCAVVHLLPPQNAPSAYSAVICRRRSSGCLRQTQKSRRTAWSCSMRSASWRARRQSCSSGRAACRSCAPSWMAWTRT